MKLLLSPHQDDEALFASYIILREKPLVLTCIDGARRRAHSTVEGRFAESRAAMRVLGAAYDHLWVPLEPDDWEGLERRILLKLDGAEPEHVWAPFPEPKGHRHHNRLGELATRLWPSQVSFYATYTFTEEEGVRRSIHGTPVATEPGWEDIKRSALACYRSQRDREGTAMHFRPPFDEREVATLRLNLGGELNQIPGYVNMDVSYDWRFQDGLGMWGDGSAEVVTESHALMYLPVKEWSAVFSEIARVLQPGGLVRITQDAIGAPGSNRPRIRPHAEVATTADLVLRHLAQAGIPGAVVSQDETGFVDRSAMQRNYGDEPDVFHAEAVKPSIALKAAA